MKKNLTIGIIAIILAAGGVLMYLSKQSSGASTSNTAKTSTQLNLTRSEVAKHTTPDNCWTIIHDNVYDVTKYGNLHPGGKEILRACGTDATVMFESRTTNDGQKIGSGTKHSSAANAQLGQFLIGKLQK